MTTKKVPSLILDTLILNIEFWILFFKENWSLIICKYCTEIALFFLFLVFYTSLYFSILLDITAFYLICLTQSPEWE